MWVLKLHVIAVALPARCIPFDIARVEVGGHRDLAEAMTCSACRVRQLCESGVCFASGHGCCPLSVVGCPSPPPAPVYATDNGQRATAAQRPYSFSNSTSRQSDC